MGEQHRRQAEEWLAQVSVSFGQIDHTSDEDVRQAHRTNAQSAATAALASAVLYLADKAEDRV
jgi:hypothetical protein